MQGVGIGLGLALLEEFDIAGVVPCGHSSFDAHGAVPTVVLDFLNIALGIDFGRVAGEEFLNAESRIVKAAGLDLFDGGLDRRDVKSQGLLEGIHEVA